MNAIDSFSMTLIDFAVSRCGKLQRAAGLVSRQLLPMYTEYNTGQLVVHAVLPPPCDAFAPFRDYLL